MFAKTKFNKKAVSLLLCIIAAFGLWVYVSYVENPDMTRWIKDRPVTISGEAKLNESGLAIREIVDSKIDLKLSAKRNTFRNLDIKAVADVSSITQEGEVTITANVTFPGSTGVSIEDRSGHNITLIIEKFDVQTFTVKPNITKNPQNGYFVKSTHLPDGKDMLISVSGGISAVSRINHITTDEIDLSAVIDNTKRALTFTPVDDEGKEVEGVELTLTQANVEFVIHKEAPLPLTVNITADDPLLTCQLTPPAVYISGPAAVVDALEPVVVANINENAYNAGDTLTYNIAIPADVTLRDKDPAQVELQFIETP